AAGAVQVGRAGRVDGGVAPRRGSEVAVNHGEGVVVESHDLPRVIDPQGEAALKSACAGVGVVEGGVLAAAQQETVVNVVGVQVVSHDLSGVIDHGGEGTEAVGGI